MVKINEVFLVTRNARDKIQTARYILMQEKNNYIIQRFTGQFKGKITTQPEKLITQGKVKRTVLQQAELEFNSLIKKALDKGYKKLSDLTNISYTVITQEELNTLVPTIKTDANGNIKPQQAKSSNDCSMKLLDREAFASRKLDGVRCLMKYVNGTIVTSSRGGKDYDIPTTQIREDPTLIEFFKENPDIILDGEIYTHGVPLQVISGIARLKTWEERCESLQYWIYDIADIKQSFNKRLEILMDMELLFEDNPKIKIVEHEYVSGWTKVKKLHNKYVEEGFEGLVLRNPNKEYLPGRRTADWIKVKEYQDAEFEIVGISEGLRDEDMCFTMKTEDGKTFNAKPIGTREIRQDYLENWPLYVGKFATVKFFGYSIDGTPTQPSFKAVREKGE